MSNANWRHFDFWLLGAVAILTVMGIAMIRSTLAGNIALTESNLPMRQFVFAAAGFVFVFIMAVIDYHYWSSMSTTMYVATVIVLSLLFVVGTVAFGSARRFETGIISIQPSEIAKIVVILTLGNYLARNRERIRQFGGVIFSLGMTMMVVIWILLQPNMSTSIVIMVIWFALAWASGMQFRHISILAGISIIVVLISIPLYPILKEAKVINEYQIRRIETFLSPEEGATSGEVYNLDQAEISIGSGGLLGQGYGQGTQVQLRFLKVRWSDFIFASMAHEFGFVGVGVMMALQLFVVWRCLRAARLAADTYGALICYGVATLLAFQGLVNIGVNLRLLPATGLPLPFISYGGSSLLSLLMGIGLVESVLLRHKSLEF
ncbi:MAG: FtsW/RodA/SpoVE family cell cycle protein [Chloroflexota bacterium]